MRIALYLSAGLPVLGVLLVSLRKPPAGSVVGPASSPRPELEYFKAVNSVAPPKDPQLLFLLMAQYSSANMQSEGAEFFSARLKEFGPRLKAAKKACSL